MVARMCRLKPVGGQISKMGAVLFYDSDPTNCGCLVGFPSASPSLPVLHFRFKVMASMSGVDQKLRYTWDDQCGNH